MLITKFQDVPGEEFPAGRLTKVIIGPQCKLQAHNFVMGYVTIYPGGSVPCHSHAEEEVYTVLEGEGEMTVGEESCIITAPSSVYIPSGQPHTLENTSTTNLVMMFVYAPANIVAHWAAERTGKL